MSNTNLLLGANWSIDEWPEFVTVSHEGAGDGIDYVPKRTCHDISREEFFKCSECCHAIEVEYGDSNLYDGNFIADSFDYCPYCGAKVVYDERQH